MFNIYVKLIYVSRNKHESYTIDPNSKIVTTALSILRPRLIENNF